VLNSDDLRTFVNADLFQSCQDIAQTKNSFTSTVFRHLKEIEKASKFGKWVPHQLTEKQQIKRVNIATSLLTRQHAQDILDRVITGDEKWILYEDNKQKRKKLDADDSGKSTVKNDLHPKNILLSIWWDKREVVYCELLPMNQNITAEVYSAQLSRLNEELKEKWSALVTVKE